jgi:hypothetical protein
MSKTILKNKLWLVIILCLVLSLTTSNAFAWGGHGHYYYRGGRWYNGGWFWGGVATGLVIGATVASLPPYYNTVYVGGVPYYYDGTYYYQSGPTGYVVVQQPAQAPVVVAPAVATSVVASPAISQPNVASTGAVVINIPNASGSYTPVSLTKHKTGYIGPQGEYYEGHPTVEQLKVLYGK